MREGVVIFALFVLRIGVVGGDSRHSALSAAQFGLVRNGFKAAPQKTVRRFVAFRR